MQKKILIVEGETDKHLMSVLLVKYKIKDIEIWPPKMAGTTGNGVNNLIDSIKLALKGIQGGRFSHIGVIVDADYPHEHGYRSRRKLIVDAFNAEGFSHSLSAGQISGKGEVLLNNKFPCRCGFWIMPDHSSDGMAETLLKSAIVPTQKLLLADAMNAVNNLQNPLFSQTHVDKAILSTWLAWQKWTGMPTEKAVERDIIDSQSPALDQFKKWLIELFEN
jgi:hypothetical protein